MKCESCGAPVEDGKCTYCGRDYSTPPPKPQQSNTSDKYVKPASPKDGSARTSKKYQYTPSSTRPKSKKKSGCGTIIIILFILGMIGAIFGDSDDSDSKDTSSVWAAGITPIEDFKYYLDGGKVYLQDYTGHEHKVKVGNSYEIDGKEYAVADTIEDLFCLNRVDSIILPEGIVTMPKNTFNSCGAEYLYLPKSMKTTDENNGFYTYLHDVKKIYYGGSEEEWAELTNNAERVDIDAIEIIYNADPEDLK